MKKTRRGPQVTCRGCPAYRFPHRLGGGSCDGSAWAASYFLHEREFCESCPANRGSFCEVAQGQESIKHCEGFQEHLKNQTPASHPTTEQELGDYLYESYQSA